MIIVLRGGDYQRMAENLVGIERNRLSVFVLHKPKIAELSAPQRLTLVYNRMSNVFKNCSHD